MAKRTKHPEGGVAVARPASRLSDGMLAELIESTRASLERAHSREEVRYAAALAELELEAARRGLQLPSCEPAPVVERPEDNIPPVELALFAGSQENWLEVLATLGPDELHHAWRLARSHRDVPAPLRRLTALCLVLDQRVFGEEAAEQRHRHYALMPVPPEERLQLVDDAIEATFTLLGLRVKGG